MGQTEKTALTNVKQRAGGKLPHSTGSSAQCSVATQRGGMGWGGRKVQHGRNIPVADSHFCKPEANTILESSYSPVKK